MPIIADRSIWAAIALVKAHADNFPQRFDLVEHLPWLISPIRADTQQSCIRPEIYKRERHSWKNYLARELWRSGRGLTILSCIEIKFEGHVKDQTCSSLVPRVKWTWQQDQCLSFRSHTGEPMPMRSRPWEYLEMVIRQNWRSRGDIFSWDHISATQVLWTSLIPNEE